MPVAGVRSLVSSSIIISGGWPCSVGGRGAGRSPVAWAVVEVGGRKGLAGEDEQGPRAWAETGRARVRCYP